MSEKLPPCPCCGSECIAVNGVIYCKVKDSWSSECWYRNLSKDHADLSGIKAENVRLKAENEKKDKTIEALTKAAQCLG